MERVCFNKSFDQYEIQPHKRSLPNDEISPIKRRKSDSPRLTEPSLNSHPSQRSRNPHFANDRLTTLRKQINSDVILTSTVVNPDILENRISPIKHPERKYIVPSRKRNDYPSSSSIRDLKETCATNDGYIMKSSSPKKSGNKIILNNSRSSGSQSTSAYDKSLIKFKVETTVSVPFSKTCDEQNLTTSLRRDIDNIGVPGIKISEKSHEIMKKRYSKRHKYLNPANIFSEKKRHENKDIKTPLDTYDNTSPSNSDRTVSKYETYYEKIKVK
ncbi:hypothetical protein HHI36_019571 [Cryptolaemus montrouzieri]|uniref:Uncharacterized protein n=1 Tax=Cryptolaemus montrouzieri TaxID=559131 RepID=A0ABD2N7U9_9CUCU